MQLVSLFIPEFGLFFWQTVVLFLSASILGRYAWKPILQAIQTQEEAYTLAMRQMMEAKLMVQQQQHLGEDIIQKAHEQRKDIIAQALDTRQKLLQEAHEAASAIKKQMLEEAQETISQERQASYRQLKSELVEVVLKTTELLLHQELRPEYKQEGLIQRILEQEASRKINS